MPYGSLIDAISPVIQRNVIAIDCETMATRLFACFTHIMWCEVYSPTLPDEPVAIKDVRRLTLVGLYNHRSVKRAYPEGASLTNVVSNSIVLISFGAGLA